MKKMIENKIAYFKDKDTFSHHYFFIGVISLVYQRKMLLKIKTFDFQKKIKCIFFISILKNSIKNRKFKFLTTICKIRKKRKNAKLSTSIKSTNFFRHCF